MQCAARAAGRWGAAEAFERHIQTLFRDGRHRLLSIWGACPRSTKRAFGARPWRDGRTARRRRLPARGAEPSRCEPSSSPLLSSVFEIYDSITEARIASWPWRAIRLTAFGSVLCALLVWAGLEWRVELSGLGDAAESLVSGKPSRGLQLHRFQPFFEVLKLVAAMLVGLLITAIHQPTTRDRRSSMAQAQTLLCVSGAMVMIIIGNSLARAFGIAGAASIIRFRTPVDDPKDVTVLFLLMGLGMSLGVGAFAVAGMGTAFLSVALVALDWLSTDPLRVMSVELTANGGQFPTSHVEGVFARHGIAVEPREISTANGVAIKYHAWLSAQTSLEDVSAELMAEDGGVKSVAWGHAKRERV